MADAGGIQCPVQPHVGHDRCHDRVLRQRSALPHGAGKDVQDPVAVHLFAVLVHRDTAVCVAVKGKAHVQMLRQNQPPQSFDMRRAGVQVDVQSVRVGVDDVGARTERLKNRLGYHPRGTVGAIQPDAQGSVGMCRQRDQVSDVPVPPGGVIHNLTDIGSVRERQFIRIQPQCPRAAVQIVLDDLYRPVVDLLPVAVDQLDAVIRKGIMRGGYHNAAVKLPACRRKADTGCGGNVQHIGIRAARNQPCDQRILKQVAGAAGVLADDHAHFVRRAGSPVAPAPVVPRQKPPDPPGMVACQCGICFPPEAVGAEIFAHSCHPFPSVGTESYSRLVYHVPSQK